VEVTKRIERYRPLQVVTSPGADFWHSAGCEPARRRRT
jgi:hypothetical protein